MAKKETPFEAELVRYHAGEVTLDELASWVKAHEWVPLEPVADSVWWTDDPMPPMEPDSFYDIYLAYAGLDRTLSEADYDVLLAAYESTNPPVNSPPSGKLPGG